MSEFRAATNVNAGKEALFDYLSEVGNLPRYFERMTSAGRGEGDEVVTSAKLPDGRQVQGSAWFRVDAAAHRVEWGAEGANSYHGSLELREAGDGTEVEVRMHTTRVPDGDETVQQGLEGTLANIKRLVEQHSAVG
ncbi:SRPBCC family protein [Amycolatopsis sp. WQ 127309]|uniref:SRPBCC family protein n=1 Tax=Amycolatopsis sp. WQ 127309 TaxID=2932773 RepID=UPI001FF6ABAC|nr:SRPBCC family protein [Amycolatopsis sp. WQ 127309]UOZ05514.1 SRPBCC family protein [Amycolatopsis sp. WQ 127309]